jgi:hypothetical protein
MLHCHITTFRVARTIGKKQSVEFQFIEIIIPWYTNYLNTSP